MNRKLITLWSVTDEEYIQLARVNSLECIIASEQEAGETHRLKGTDGVNPARITGAPIYTNFRALVNDMIPDLGNLEQVRYDQALPGEEEERTGGSIRLSQLLPVLFDSIDFYREQRDRLRDAIARNSQGESVEDYIAWLSGEADRHGNLHVGYAKERADIPDELRSAAELCSKGVQPETMTPEKLADLLSRVVLPVEALYFRKMPGGTVKLVSIYVDRNSLSSYSISPEDHEQLRTKPHIYAIAR